MIKQVRANYDAPVIEKEIQAFWESTKAYEKTKELRSSGEKFHFLDGPPYTTGSIHLGTAMNKTLKDIMIRYFRMKGYNVRDQPGFDMHGLPIEVQVEKKIGVHSKKEIEEIGIDKFVDTCKKFASELRESMTDQFKQLGVWMDWDNPYQTLKLDYIESAWWTVSRAYEKGLLGPSSKVVSWCPRCETALAEAEIEYWDETDPSVIVRLPLTETERSPILTRMIGCSSMLPDFFKSRNASLLIWTTTPWTLPSNMAAAIHPRREYAMIRLFGKDKEEHVVCLHSQAEYIAKKGGYDGFEVLIKAPGT